MTNPESKPRIAVVGATGLAGRALLECLADAGYPSEQVVALASERSAAEDVSYGDETLEVEAVTPESFRSVQVALLATPPRVSRLLASAANAAGAWAVDLSSAFRLDPDTPLVHWRVNAEAARTPRKGRVVCCPSSAMCALLTVLEPLRQRFRLSRALVTALLGAAVGGIQGVRELEEQTRSLLSGRDSETQVFPQRTGFNLIPQVGEFGRGEWTMEEMGWIADASRIWAGQANAPRVLGTAIQAPVFYGDFLSVELALEEEVSASQVREVLTGAEGVKVLDTPSEAIYPMPMLVSSDPSVHVGRIRVAPAFPKSCLLVAASDGPRVVARNAVAIAEDVMRASH